MPFFQRLIKDSAASDLISRSFVQALAGGPCFAGALAMRSVPYDGVVNHLLDAGKLYCVVAGLLNLMAVLDAMQPRGGTSEC